MTRTYQEQKDTLALQYPSPAALADLLSRAEDELKIERGKERMAQLAAEDLTKEIEQLKWLLNTRKSAANRAKGGHNTKKAGDSPYAG